MKKKENLEFDNVTVRSIKENDLEPIIRIDEKNIGRRREEYIKSKFQECLKKSSIIISLVAETDGIVAGFIMGEIFYGEFGHVEKTVNIDTLGVDPAFTRRGIAAALIEQFLMNVRGLHVSRIETLVDWQQSFDLLGFFRKVGFKPGERIHLSLNMDEVKM